VSNNTFDLLSTILIAVAILTCSFTSYADVPEDFDFTVATDANYVEGQLLVRFAPKPGGIQRNMTERNQILTSLGGGSLERNYKIIPGLSLVKLPQNINVEDALIIYNNTDGVLHAQPDYLLRALSTFPNDTDFDDLWGMHNTGQTGGTSDADIDAPEAWDIQTGSSDIIVAVIDTGVDYNHPDLKANMWINEAEYNGTADFDDDGNGYIDDIYGYDFCTCSDYWCENSNKQRDPDPMDDKDHGTHCAGIIGAIGNNNEGIVGVCWDVKIMALKFLNYAGYGKTSDAIACIEYADENGARVLSNSWGGGPDTYNADLEDAIEATDANGLVFVAAAGNYQPGLYWYDNDVTPVYPANYDVNNIISVLATDDDDEIWDYSHYGANTVDLGAPGDNILSCILNDGYGKKNGTSMAAPHVAGAVALIWSRNKSLTHMEVKDIILNSVDQLESLDDLCVTEGRLNIYNAIALTPTLYLDKIDVNAPNAVLPGDYITYEITYGPDNRDYNNIIITDYLPVETDFVSATHGEIGFPPDYPLANYDPDKHIVTWEVNDLNANDPNEVLELVVRVNELAEPNGTITNYCEIESDCAYNNTEVSTPVACWSPDIIYVDVNAFGNNIGTSWTHAYTDLQDALETARDCGCDEIWAAEGTYYTHIETVDSALPIAFELVEGVGLYGGFAGYETNRSQRNWILNQTILDGDIPGGYTDSDTDHIVIAEDVNESAVLDGFIIQKGFYAGIKIDNSSPIVENVKIEETVGYNYDGNHSYGGSGIYCTNNASPTIKNCIIINSEGSGIYSLDSSLSVSDCNIASNGYRQNNGLEVRCGIYSENPSITDISKSIIHGNKSNGIYFNDDTSDPLVQLKNDIIYGNGEDGIYWYCDAFDDVNLIVYNNTIIDNGRYGFGSNGYPYSISNCIIWDNDTGDLQYGDYDVTYSCIEGGYDGDGNTDSNPQFWANDEFYHLSPDSTACIDKGDPSYNPEPNETDIDGEDRVIDGDEDGTATVDMGADEYYWSKADFDVNEIVNFIDYAILANAWMTEYGDPNYNETCDLADNNVIDNNDLELFCQDWLWQAGWAKQRTFGISQPKTMGMGKMSEGYFAETVTAQAAEKSSEPKELTEEEVEETKLWLEDLLELWQNDSAFQQDVEEDVLLDLIDSVVDWLEKQL